MLKHWIKVAFCGLLVASALTAMAQGGGQRGQGGGRQGGMMGRMGGGDSLVGLANRADVQRDIAVSADQKAKLEAMQEKQREDMQAMMEQIRNSGQMPDREAMQKMMQDAQAKQNEELKKILSADQLKRLGEIRIQVAGNRALMFPEVQKELGFTADQQAKLRSLQQKQQEANQSLMEKMRNQEISREEMQEARQRNDKAMNDELAKILTEAQKGKLKEMGGKEFKADPQPQRGGGN